MSDHRDLSRLKQLFAASTLYDFDERVGLLFYAQPTRLGYDQTPRNCTAFATTGGDGVHFGFLDFARNGEASPIVMTVPMADEPNRVVGRDMLHFLRLGTAAGFFVLEQLQYDFDEAVAWLRQGRLRAEDPEAHTALAAIADSMQAPSWGDHRAELQALHDDFAPMMDVAEDT